MRLSNLMMLMPKAISANPRATLDALLADGSTYGNFAAGLLQTGTTNLSAWGNRFGAMPSLIQATGANQPVINVDGSVSFDGIAQFMTCATANQLQPYSIHFVLSTTTWALYRYLINAGLTIYGNGVSPQLSVLIGIGGNSLPTAALGVKNVLSVIANGATSSVYLNGVLLWSGAMYGSALTNMFLCRSSGATGYYNADLHEIIIRNGSAQYASIIAELKTVHGIV